MFLYFTWGGGEAWGRLHPLLEVKNFLSTEELHPLQARTLIFARQLRRSICIFNGGGGGGGGWGHFAYPLYWPHLMYERFFLTSQREVAEWNSSLLHYSARKINFSTVSYGTERLEKSITILLVSSLPVSGRLSQSSGVGGRLFFHSFSMERRYLMSSWKNCTNHKQKDFSFFLSLSFFTKVLLLHFHT